MQALEAHLRCCVRLPVLQVCGHHDRLRAVPAVTICGRRSCLGLQVRDSRASSQCCASCACLKLQYFIQSFTSIPRSSMPGGTADFARGASPRPALDAPLCSESCQVSSSKSGAPDAAQHAWSGTAARTIRGMTERDHVAQCMLARAWAKQKACILAAACAGGMTHDGRGASCRQHYAS